MLDRIGLRERLDEIVLPERKYPEIRHSDVIMSMIGLLCLGKPDFDAIEPFREDEFFTQ
jgi:hypothetical protein